MTDSRILQGITKKVQSTALSKTDSERRNGGTEGNKLGLQSEQELYLLISFHSPMSL